MSDNPPVAASIDVAPIAKRIQAFYIGKDDVKAPPVSLWVIDKTKPGSPDFDGTINSRRVAGYLHQGPKRGFISFIDSKAGKDAAGHYIQVATGNVVVNSAGIPKLVITLADKTQPIHEIWAEVSLKLSVELQVAAGLNLKKQAANKAAHLAKKAQASKTPVVI